MAIKRIWHGWTTLDNANHYESLLNREVFPGIEAKGIPGYLGIELLRRNLDQEVEFITIMTFESLEDVKAFQGKDFTRAYIPDRAKDLLKRWDDTSSHYEIIQQRF